MPDIRGRFPGLRYLGFGFVSLSVYSTYAASSLNPGMPESLVNTGGAWTLSMVASALTLLVGAVVLGGKREARTGRLALPALLLGVLGAVLEFAPAPAGDAALLLGAAMAGASFGMQCLLWAQVFSRLEVEQAEFVVPAASAVIPLCMLARHLLDGMWQAPVNVLLPLASLACVYLCDRHRPEDEAEGASPTPSAAPGTSAARDMACLSAGIAAIYLATGWIDAAQPASLPGVSEACFSLFGLLLAVMFILHAPNVGFEGLFRWAVPLVAVGLLLSSVNTQAAWAGAACVSGVTDAAFQTITFVYFASAWRRGGVGAVRGVGLAMCAAQVGAIAGNAVGLQPLGPNGTVLLALAAALCIGSSVVPRKRPAWAVSESADAPTGEARYDRVASFAARHGLTPRETDVFALLAQGRTQPYIREKLCLSKSTVSTYAANVYRKCGVHSKQELIDMVAEEAGA